ASFFSASVPELSIDLTKVSGDRFSGLNQNKSVKERKLYFSETAPNVEPEQFYITVEPNQPKVYDPNFQTPDITVEEGTTEDWIVQNRTLEAHAFH
ncbi:MAG: cupredoxin domain-containing protein, partial [Nostoc sp.]